MATPILDKFLEEIARIVKASDGPELQAYLIIEPPLPRLYSQIVTELRRTYPVFNQGALETKITSFVPEYDESEDGGSRSSFISFMLKYFAFLRDVDVESLLETHDMLKSLLNQCILALSSSIGQIVLPTVISLSRTLARLAIGLDKRPDLVAHLSQRGATAGGEEATERVTLVEGSANVIREAFKKCLSERSGPPNGIENGKPEGRRIGIYVTANLCLKLFFQCRKLRSAEQIFGNIYQQSPPLALFPASQRVTFLYYLGRYLFANSHFFRAQLALQAAYDQCHIRCTSQRRLILVYLIASNVILGRFPTPQLYQRPEAIGLQEMFQPICTAISKGDIASFRRYVDLDASHADWFLRKRILLQLSNRCELLVWRSLARRTFLLSGSHGDASKKAAPTLALQDVLTLAISLETAALTPLPHKTISQPNDQSPDPGLRKHTNSIFVFPDNDNNSNGTSPQPQNPPTAVRKIHIDPDLAGAVDDNENDDIPTIETIESLMASLVEQDLLHGFLSHSQHRFAITGAKNANPLTVGFPPVWGVLAAKADMEVPGWVREKKGPVAMMGGFRPGMVVNLSGARPVGNAGLG